MKKIVLFLILFGVNNSFGRSVSSYIDSLTKVTINARQDTSKVTAFNDISKRLWLSGYYDRAMDNARQALALAEKINYKRGIASACNNIGVIFIQQNNYSEGFRYYAMALSIRKEIGDKLATSSSYINMGNAYLQLDNYPEALKNYLAALKIGEETDDGGIIVNSYSSIGNVYEQQGNYAEALKNHYASLKMSGDEHRNSMTYVNIGDVYTKQKNYTEALNSFFAALKIQKSQRDTQIISSCYGSIGSVYMQQGKYKDALKNFLRAFELQQRRDDKYGIADSYINIGKAYTGLNQIPVAKNYLIAGLSFAKANKSKIEMKDAYEGLCKLDSITGNIKGAFSYYLLYSAMKDSISNAESNKQISQLKIQYETDKKDQQIKTQTLQINSQNLQLQNKTLQNKVLKTQIYYGITISLMMIGIVVLLYYLSYSRNKRKKKEYEHMLTDLELNVLKSQLNPHFISNALNAIKSIIDQQPERASLFLIKFARLMRRVLEQNELPLISLREELDTTELYIQIESLRLRYGLDYKFDCDPSIDSELLLVPPLILQPTIENAIWHGLSTKSEKGYITIGIKMENDLLKFTIEDNGKGKESQVTVSSIQLPKRKSFGVSITRKRIEILSKELKKEGYYRLNFLEGRTITEIALPLDI